MDWVVGFRPRELARLRTARGLTLDAIARALSVSDRSRIARWESGGDTPSPRALVALAHLLEVDPLELLDGGRAAPTLATLRSAAGLTRGQAATRVGMSRSAYLRLDAGHGRRDLPADLAAALARAFGVEERVVLNAHARTRAADRDTSAPTTLRQLRRGRTAADVARRLGISERSWYRWESGRGPELPAGWTAVLAELFDTSTDAIQDAHRQAREQSAGRANAGRGKSASSRGGL